MRGLDSAPCTCVSPPDWRGDTSQLGRGGSRDVGPPVPPQIRSAIRFFFHLKPTLITSPLLYRLQQLTWSDWHDSWLTFLYRKTSSAVSQSHISQVCFSLVKILMLDTEEMKRRDWCSISASLSTIKIDKVSVTDKEYDWKHYLISACLVNLEYSHGKIHVSFE